MSHVVDAMSRQVDGKSVALVGNAMSLLHTIENHGPEIDQHDEVVRMNAGIPHILPPGRIGYRTTVWATAKHFGTLDPRPELMVFMKLTRLGDRHWAQFEREERPYRQVRWTQELEHEVRDFVGADPGTGIRMLYMLKRKCRPASVRVFGMDCWQTLSSWSSKPNTPNHVPDLEKQAMLSLLSE